MDDSQHSQPEVEARGDGLVPQVGTVPKEACASKHLVVIDELINWMLMNPGVSVSKASFKNGGPIQYSAVWLKQVASADAFRARLREKQSQIDAALLVPSLREKLHHTTEMAVERIADMLPVATDPGFILDAAEMLLKAQYGGYAGAPAQPPGQPPAGNTFVIDRATIAIVEERRALLEGKSNQALITDATVIPEGNKNA